MIDTQGNVSAADLPVGDIEFLDNFIPNLVPGRYTVTVDHQVSGGVPVADLGDDEKQTLEATVFSATQRFQVQGSRFAIDPSEIHAVFPPRGSNGIYEQRLAHVVLNKRALPWEHPLGSKESPVDRAVPWLALLVLKPEELLTTLFPPPANPGQRSPTRSATMALTDVLGTQSQTVPGETILRVGPTLKLSSWEDPAKTQVQVIDLAAATFTKLAPNLAVAPLLTHVRQVHVGDKPELGLKDSGWFSLVVSDRLPEGPSPGLPTPAPYIAHLVSIEGFERYLDAKNPQSFPAGDVVVRMITLASWTFGVKAEGESFAQLLTDLVKPASEQGTGWLLRLPQTPARKAAAAGPDQEPATLAARALSVGYTALPYQTRVGDETFGWYRGPLSPVSVAPYLAAAPPRTAVEAMVYDKDRGLFDLSYAVAFQTGRLLALSSSSFSVALLNWRRRLHRTVDTLVERAHSAHLRAFTGDRRGLAERSVEELRALVEPATPIQDRFARLLVGDFAKHVAPKLTEASPEKPCRGLAAPVRCSIAWREEIRAAIALPAVIELLGSIPDLIPDDIVTWLAKRVLLMDVPFNNFVPDGHMLPSESIRFFHVDDNWLQALVDGALSVGAQSFRDTEMTQSMRSALISAVAVKVMAMGTPPVPSTTASPASLPSMTGFLLRSAAVSGYRALQVKGFSDRNNGNLIPTLRLVELSPSVLLALFAGVPKVVAIDEPREGLGFGVEDGNAVEVRYVSGTNAGKPYPNADAPETVTAPLIPVSHRIDIPALRQAIQAKVAPGAPGFGPADLALNLVHIPEQMVWETPAQSPHD